MTRDQMIAVVGVVATVLVAIVSGLLYLRHEAMRSDERRARRRLLYVRLLDDPATGPRTRAEAEAGLVEASRPNGLAWLININPAMVRYAGILLVTFLPLLTISALTALIRLLAKVGQ